MKTKVCFIFCYHNPEYSPTKVVLEAFKLLDEVELVECVTKRKSFLRYFELLYKFLKLKKRDIDVYYLAFRGHEIIPFLRLVTRKPIIFDAHISLYDTLCLDRKRVKEDSFLGRFIKWYDRFICRISNKIILDTDQHIKYFVETFNLPPKKFHKIYVGVENSVFFPKEEAMEDHLKVLWFGNFLPLHGIPVILEAAELLKDYKDIKFKLIGDGILRKEMMRLVYVKSLDNVELPGRLERKYLPDEIASSDICLGGHFGTSNKSQNTIAGKLFEMIAMKKPVIAGESLAVKELFKNKEEVLMCKAGDSESLAKAILLLKKDKALREKISERGYQVYLERCTPKAITNSLIDLLSNVH